MHRKRMLAVALLVAALNLRLTVAAVSPVLTQIRQSTGLSSAGGGVLTAVPVICFGIIAFTAPRLIRRFSMGPLLSLTLLMVIAGCAIRLDPSVGPLFAGTAVLGTGIAVANVLVPALIKRDFANQRVLMTALYSVALSGGSAISAGFTVPFEHATGAPWQDAVALWGAGAVVAIALWTPHVREERASAGDAAGAPVHELWRDRLAWCVTGFWGMQSFGFYGLLSWLPTILASHGVSAATGGWMLSYMTILGMSAALVTPALERRARRRWVLVVISSTISVLGLVGLLVAPRSALYLWVGLLGLGTGSELALGLGYIVGRASDSAHAAQLSTMAQGAGYMIAATAPFIMGGLHGLTHAWTAPILVLVAAVVPMLLTGLVASQSRYVGATATT